MIDEPPPTSSKRASRLGIDRRQQLTVVAVWLVIEIADSALIHDLGYKADLYRRAKIPQYWMVDVPNRCVWIFTLAGER
jgi:Uma2 family endonuclease